MSYNFAQQAQMEGAGGSEEDSPIGAPPSAGAELEATDTGRVNPHATQIQKGRGQIMLAYLHPRDSSAYSLCFASAASTFARFVPAATGRDVAQQVQQAAKRFCYPVPPTWFTAMKDGRLGVYLTGKPFTSRAFVVAVTSTGHGKMVYDMWEMTKRQPAVFYPGYQHRTPFVPDAGVFEELTELAQKGLADPQVWASFSTTARLEIVSLRDDSLGDHPRDEATDRLLQAQLGPFGGSAAPPSTSMFPPPAPKKRALLQPTSPPVARSLQDELKAVDMKQLAANVAQAMEQSEGEETEPVVKRSRSQPAFVSGGSSGAGAGAGGGPGLSAGDMPAAVAGAGSTDTGSPWNPVLPGFFVRHNCTAPAVRQSLPFSLPLTAPTDVVPHPAQTDAVYINETGTRTTSAALLHLHAKGSEAYFVVNTNTAFASSRPMLVTQNPAGTLFAPVEVQSMFPDSATAMGLVGTALPLEPPVAQGLPVLCSTVFTDAGTIRNPENVPQVIVPHDGWEWHLSLCNAVPTVCGFHSLDLLLPMEHQSEEMDRHKRLYMINCHSMRRVTPEKAGLGVATSNAARENDMRIVTASFVDSRYFTAECCATATAHHMARVVMDARLQPTHGGNSYKGSFYGHESTVPVPLEVKAVQDEDVRILLIHRRATAWLGNETALSTMSDWAWKQMMGTSCPYLCVLVCVRKSGAVHSDAPLPMRFV